MIPKLLNLTNTENSGSWHSRWCAWWKIGWWNMLLYSRKVWRVESLMNLANHSWFTKLKPSKLVLAINNLWLIYMLICQTFLCQMLKNSKFAKLLCRQIFLLYGFHIYFDTKLLLKYYLYAWQDWELWRILKLKVLHDDEPHITPLRLKKTIYSNKTLNYFIKQGLSANESGYTTNVGVYVLTYVCTYIMYYTMHIAGIYCKKYLQIIRFYYQKKYSQFLNIISTRRYTDNAGIQTCSSFNSC